MATPPQIMRLDLQKTQPLGTAWNIGNYPLAGKYGSDVNTSLSGASYGNPISPYAGQEAAIDKMENPEMRDMMRIILEERRYENDPVRIQEQLKTYGDFRKKEAWDAFGMKALASIPETIARTVYNRDALGILANIPNQTGPILQSGVQSANLRDRFKYFG
jgi:hypothetical protein